MTWSQEVQHERQKAAEKRAKKAWRLQRKGQPLDLMAVNSAEPTLAQFSVALGVYYLFRQRIPQRYQDEWPLSLVTGPVRQLLTWLKGLRKPKGRRLGGQPRSKTQVRQLRGQGQGQASGSGSKPKSKKGKKGKGKKKQ